MKTVELLVSVRSAEEAIHALQGGASIIDVKEPARGALGRADVQTIREIADVLDGRALLSVAMGDLAELEQSIAHEPMTLPAGITYTKIGLAGEADVPGWRARLAAMFARFPQTNAVPVAYWDAANVHAPLPDDVLDWALEHKAAVFLIDTADKAGPGLLAEQDDLTKLRPMLEKAHAHDLAIALAGKLVGPSFEAAANLANQSYGPAILGVRTAACDKNLRHGTICPQAVRKLRTMIENVCCD